MTYQLVWLQILPKYGKINVLKAVFDISGFQEEGMGLFLWPARKILGAEVACEHFLPRHLANGIPAVFDIPVGRHPLTGLGTRMHLRRLRHGQASQHDGDAAKCA